MLSAAARTQAGQRKAQAALGKAREKSCRTLLSTEVAVAAQEEASSLSLLRTCCSHLILSFFSSFSSPPSLLLFSASFFIFSYSTSSSLPILLPCFHLLFFSFNTTFSFTTFFSFTFFFSSIIAVRFQFLSHWGCGKAKRDRGDLYICF